MYCPTFVESMQEGTTTDAILMFYADTILLQIVEGTTTGTILMLILQPLAIQRSQVHKHVVSIIGPLPINCFLIVFFRNLVQPRRGECYGLSSLS